MEISVLAGKIVAETAVGPVIDISSSKVEYWGFIREGGDWGVVGRLEDRRGSGKMTGEELEEEREIVEA